MVETHTFVEEFDTEPSRMIKPGEIDVRCYGKIYRLRVKFGWHRRDVLNEFFTTRGVNMPRDTQVRCIGTARDEYSPWRKISAGLTLS